VTEFRFEPQHPAPERALELLRVLSQPVRVKILRAMVDGRAMRVSDVAAAIGEAPNSVSYHLRQLEKAGVARRAEPDPRRDGRETWWTVPDWTGLSLDIGAIRALPGGDAVLRALDQKEAQEVLGLFSVERAEAAEKLEQQGWTGVRADGPLRLTRDEAESLSNETFNLFTRAGQLSRAHGEGDDVRDYDYRLAFLPRADPEPDADPPARLRRSPSSR